MKQVIPFYKEIVFKTNIAVITSISLEHEENILDGEISGNFILFGKYKIHNDTTEELDFKYRLPFTTLIPDDVIKESIVLDVENFTFEQIEEDVLRIDIDFSITGEVNEDNRLDIIDQEIDEILGIDEVKDDVNEVLVEEENNNFLEIVKLDDDREEEIVEESINIESDITSNTLTNNDEEYVVYHVHLVKENETVEQIVNIYNVSVDYLKEYNDICNIKAGDKLIIPEYGRE